MFKACNCLGISKECDYFGLKYQNAKGEELWLNLRNPIDRQTGGSGGVVPLRFALRVKFWVPPHLLLQEATRYNIYFIFHVIFINKIILIISDINFIYTYVWNFLRVD